MKQPRKSFIWKSETELRVTREAIPMTISRPCLWKASGDSYIKTAHRMPESLVLGVLKTTHSVSDTEVCGCQQMNGDRPLQPIVELNLNPNVFSGGAAA